MFNQNNFGHLVVFAKHDSCPQEFLFAVPCYLDVRKGDVLLVETMRGDAIATATTEMFEGRDIDEVAKRFGAYLPLKKVKAVAGKEIQGYIKLKFYDEINQKVGRAFLEAKVDV